MKQPVLNIDQSNKRIRNQFFLENAVAALVKRMAPYSPDGENGRPWFECVEVRERDFIGQQRRVSFASEHVKSRGVKSQQ